jgi:hypothetical protein
LAKVNFAKKKQAKALDLDLFRVTDLRETLPHRLRQASSPPTLKRTALERLLIVGFGAQAS